MNNWTLKIHPTVLLARQHMISLLRRLELSHDYRAFNMLTARLHTSLEIR